MTKTDRKPTSSKRYVGLDLLKLVASLLIVFHHYEQSFEVRFKSINFYGGHFYFGYLVELFFLISGFVSYNSFLVRNEKHMGIHDLIHKVLRFFPMVTFALTVAILIRSIHGIVIDNNELAEIWNWKTLFANFFLLFRGYPFFSMMGINNPTWYLCILIQCYIGFYVLLKDRIINRLPHWVLFFCCSIFAFSLNFFFPWPSFRGFECFFLGAGECALLEVPSIRRLLKKTKERIIINIISLSIAIGSIISILFVHSDEIQQILCILGVYPFLVLFFTTVVIPENRVINLLGACAFEMYIWHSPVMDFEKTILSITGITITRNAFSMIGFTTILMGLSLILYLLIEKPIAYRIKELEMKIKNNSCWRFAK